MNWKWNNGKNIKCKVCKKLFYISQSRIGTKKYCSRECAKKDNFGFKPYKKLCIICEKQFDILAGVFTNKKTCSYECWKKNNYNISIKRNKLKTTLICKICKKEYIGLLKYKNRTGKCNNCLNQILKEKRQGKNNPNYKGGLYLKRKRNSRQASIHLAACQRYKKEFLKIHDYKFCEVCKVNQNGTPQFHTHHIYSASRYPKHKQLHNSKNLILVCLNCHQKFHSGKVYRKEFLQLEEERGLKELFKRNVIGSY